MEATDLILGSYVKVKPSGMIIKVDAIHQKKVGYHSCQSKLEWIWRDLIEPIPLTPEILEKNFENEGNIFGYKDYKLNQVYTLENRGERFSLVRKCNDLTSSTFWICDILYVHELQHALKLFKIKKEIVL